MNRAFRAAMGIAVASVLAIGLWITTRPEPPVERNRSDSGGLQYRSKQLGRLCPKIVESSGLAMVASGKLWTINDSGPPHLWEVAARGACRSRIVPGAEVVDWEALAANDGYLFIGDIGDNLARRSEIVVYRIAEEDIDAGAEALRFTYPKGPRDAESMFVDPNSSDLYIISKDMRPAIFRATAPLRAGAVTVLERVGRLRIDEILPGPTDAAISPDGSRVVVVTYLGAYEIEVGERSLEKALLGARRSISLPAVEQREAVTYTPDGRSFYWTSEGEAPPLYRTRRRTGVR